MATEQAGTILVVQGDTALRELLRELLAADGYQVLQAADGEQGLDLAARARPDAILLDFGLPSDSGAEILARLSRRDATAPIPVVVLAGQPAPPADGALRPDGWIEKPFDIDVLLEQVGRVARRLAPIASCPASADRAWPPAAAGAV